MPTARLSLLRTALLAFAAWTGGATPMPAAAPPLRVAAAASLQGPLEAVAAAFERVHPSAKVEVSYGASGSLAAQIQQGAPFDLFLAADLAYPAKAAENGHGRGAVFPYATGRLVLWVRKDLGLDPSRAGLAVVQDAHIAHLALANPRLAPYGAAAEAALRAAGLWEGLQAKLVYGGNIAQTAQYLRTGAAEAGFIAASEARNPALQTTGLSWTVPETLHPRLVQGGVRLTNGAAPELADAFMAFLLAPEGQSLLARAGFENP